MSPEGSCDEPTQTIPRAHERRPGPGLTRPPAGPRLGAFHLERPIGAGGQGTVWRAVHSATGTPVGVKVLASLRARDDAALAAFRREVRSAAGLDHPGIIMVLDQGRVPPGLAAHAGLAEGSPWLAMELARTSLDALPGPYPWAETRALLGALLDALAHAHARGLVHRDIKPANVLFMESPRGPAGLSRARLADFGLAFGLDDALDPSRRAMAGTPLYMAPEQFRGELADLGPWSDLYAMGWMAWELSTGAHPFAGLEIVDIRAQKTMGAIPTLPPGAAAPVGFEAWLRRMLHLDPRQRFRWAADARAALFALPDDAPEPTAPRFGGFEAPSTTAGLGAGRGGLSGLAGGTVPSSERTWNAELTTEEFIPVEWTEPGAHAGAEAAPIAPPALPVDWRTRAREVRPALQGAGLGLFGQRTPPLLGRDGPCGALWQALHEAASGARPITVLLHGPAGSGKSRLARWLCERAEELGGAEQLRIVPEPSGPHDGLDAMVARRFSIGALPPADAHSRLLRGLYALGLSNPIDHRPLFELVGLEPEPLTQAEERHAALRALLLRLATDRPVVLHIDEAAAATDALRWLHSVAGRRDLPVLIVLSERDEALAERPEAAAAIEALSPRRISVPPLSPEDQRTLVRSSLHIDDDLLGALVERTRGNPGFTQQLLTDWVARDLLSPHPTGLRLGAGRRPTLPDGVHAAWNARVDRLEAAHGPAAVRAFELAALLGPEVPTPTWRAASRRLGVTDPHDLLEALFAAALALPGADPTASWAFAHSMLRESLQRHAAEAGRAAALHALAAELLATHGAPPAAIGLHLARSGAPAEALPLLLEGAEDALERDASSLARRLLAEARRASAALPTAQAEATHPHIAVLEAKQALRTGHFAQAEATLVALRDQVDEGTDPRLRCLVLVGLVQAALGPMHAAEARIRARDLLAAATRAGAADLVIEARVALAQAATLAGDWLEADAGWTALSRDAPAGLPANLRAQITFGPIQVAVSRGELARADALCAAAIGQLEAAGQRRRLGQVQNTHGDLLRKQGDLAGAARAYQSAERTFEVLSSAYGTAPRINLGLTLLAAEDFEAAGVALRRALGDVRAEGHAGYEYAVRHALLPVAAARRDRDRTDAHLRAIAALRERGHFLDGDLATTAEQAGDLWHRAWDSERAVACWDLAHAQWDGLGSADDAARADRKRTWGRRGPG